MRTQNIIPSHDQVGSQISLVPVKELGCGCDEPANSGLPSTIESLEFQVGGHEEVDKLGISGGACPTAVDVGCDVVYFLTVFLYNNGASGSSGIGSKDNSTIILDSDNSGSCFFMGDGLDDFFFDEELVSE